MPEQYIMMYCVYNPNGHYYGHKIKHIQAEDLQHAEEQGKQFLEKLAGKGQWEYIIAENPTSYRLHDTGKGK